MNEISFSAADAFHPNKTKSNKINVNASEADKVIANKEQITAADAKVLNRGEHKSPHKAENKLLDSAENKIKGSTKITAAKAAAAREYGDELPLQLLARVRIMAESRGWVRRRKEPTVKRVASTPIGNPVYVPLPGQEVGSGARPSVRDPKTLGLLADHTLLERGWGTQLEIAKLHQQWPQIVGKSVAANAVIEDFDVAGVLTIRARTVSWQAQLRALTAQLDARLAGVLGEGVVKELRILGPHQRSWKHGRLSVPGRGPRDTYD